MGFIQIIKAMSAKILLRVASGSMIFHLLGHSIGSATWKQTTDPVKQVVIGQMTSHKFPFMGSIRSMADYFDGYGLATSIGLILFALMLWQVSGIVKENGRIAIKFLILITICLLAWSIDEFVFFFPFAACNTLFAAILSFVAIIQIKNIIRTT